MSQTLSPIAAEWKAKGKHLDVPGTAGTYIWREGSGPIVVCVHGVPSSAFLYRKVITALAEKGLEGVALDLPGLGFADRPDKFDYTWTGLSEWLVAALNAAGIDKFHLCVHDIGGPIGFDVIRRIPERIMSLTVLNTISNVEGFTKPWIMQLFEYRLIGEFSVRSLDSPLAIPLLRFKGMMSTPTNPELRVYGELLSLGDHGRAFLQIMRSFETTKEFQERTMGALQARTFPTQVVWGKFDNDLSAVPHAVDLSKTLKLDKYFEVSGRHFLQEDCYVEIADHIADLVKSGKDRIPA